MLVILGFPREKETTGVLYQAKILPNMAQNSWALVCICFRRHKTYQFSGK